MDPQDLQLYASVAAYFRDVILAFKEEWEGEGYKSQFRSARLEFHMAMVLTGSTYNDRNVRKMQEKFNVTWNDFLHRVEVTDVMKREHCPRRLSITLLMIHYISTWKGEAISRITLLRGRKYVWSGGLYRH